MSAAAQAPERAAPEPWLAVIGIGDDGLASLEPRGAGAARRPARSLVGGARHLAMVPDHPGERIAWRSPLEATLDDLAARRGRRVVVLASGDPMCFGVGELLARRFAPGRDARPAGAVGDQPGLRPARLVAGRGRGDQPARPAAGRAAPSPRAGRAPRRAEPGRRDPEPDRGAALRARLRPEPALSPSSTSAARPSGASRRAPRAGGRRASRRSTRSRSTARPGRARTILRRVPGPARRGVPLRWHADQARGAGGDARAADAAAGPVPLGRRRRQRRGRDRVAARDPARPRAVAIERDAGRCALIAEQRAGARHARARAPAGRGARLPRRACRRRMRSSSAAAPAARPARCLLAGAARRAAAWSPTWSPSRASRRCSPGRRATAASWCGSRSPARPRSAPTTAGGRRVPVTQLAALKP